ncbi:hypothetical protein [Pseudomonas baetica]|nr:hypothetical protein [Pseudomonas baetica]
MMLQKMQPMITSFLRNYDDIVVRLTSRRGLHVAGWILAFGNLMEAITAPLYEKGKPVIPEEKREAVEAELIADTVNTILEGVLHNGEQMTIEHFAGRYEELSAVLVTVFQHNFHGAWRERFHMPEDYDYGTSTPRSLERAQEAYTQSALVYTVVTSSLASYGELHTLFNTEDIYNMYETVCRKSFEEMEFHKQAQREAAQQR